MRKSEVTMEEVIQVLFQNDINETKDWKMEQKPGVPEGEEYEDS